MERSGVFLRKTAISAGLILLFLNSLGFGLDAGKYISVDEINTDMEAYCLTVYSGTKVERFDLEVLSVVKKVSPGRNLILVKGLDERFKDSSAVHGCSGSPVFIDGRLAGALAAGWDGSLEPLYLVRPIAEMRETGSAESPDSRVNSAPMASGYDYSRPIDLDAFLRENLDVIQRHQAQPRMALPLAMSFPDEVCEENRQTFQKMGFVPFSTSGDIAAEAGSEIPLEQGGTLSLVLCGGDISLAAIGTVTEIDGDQLYGFGHSFMGQGATDLPMAAGFIHTVVAHRQSSFKFGTAGPVRGTLLFDQAAAVRGTIGQTPKTIPLKIHVKRYNDPQDRTYDCFVAVERNFTPRVLMVVLNGAGQMQGSLPVEHTVAYQGKINVRGYEPIQIDNTSSGGGIIPAAMEMGAAVGLFLNNPFEEVVIESLEADLEINPEDRLSTVWAADLSQVTAKPGQTVSVSVTLKSRRSEETAVNIALKIPETMPKGKYALQILGPAQYRQFVSQMAPQRFRAVDVPTLHDALQGIFNDRRDRLYCVMQVPATGLVMRQHELADLPPTKMLLMQDAKRIIPVEPYQNWVENSIELDRIVDGEVKVALTVE
ncbi:MAG: hypothetical protein ACYSOZ_09510 [Planctomycetota bacterium]|jgi:hypothetical protein